MITALLVILCIGAGIGIGYLLFDSSFSRSRKKIMVFGTLMIPSREVEALKNIEDLTIFIGEPGKGDGCHIYAAQGLSIRESGYGGFESGTRQRTIWGASFKPAKDGSEFNCIVIPGNITEDGIITASYERTRQSFPRPCLINIIIF